VRAHVNLLLASSNRGKLEEYVELAAGERVHLEAFPDFDLLPAFEESAATFAENAAGKALHYSRFSTVEVIAEDSGLVVPALGGAPGTKSKRYAGRGATDEQRIAKLLGEMSGRRGGERRARFVCALALAGAGRVRAVFSAAAEGWLVDAPRGRGGFGYDAVFFTEDLGKTFAELTRRQKNEISHRGKAFRKLLSFLDSREE
jgi:XTP/dITP diphosphohydrolase